MSSAIVQPLLAAFAIALPAMYSCYYFFYECTQPALTHATGRRWTDLKSRCPLLYNRYFPIPSVPGGGHLQTIFGALFRRNPALEYERFQMQMPDGGVVSLDEPVESKQLDGAAPICLLLHGLTGGSHDSYIQFFAQDAAARGYRPIVFNSRGCGDTTLQTAQFYSASFTCDLRRVVHHIRTTYPAAPIFAVGWSLGANILLRYLGEEGDAAPFAGAASLANPFDLLKANEIFHGSFYDRRLSQSMYAMLKRNDHHFAALPEKYDVHRALQSCSVKEFDEYITRVTFGWPSVEEYYRLSSSALSIPHIRVPTLCLNALDDPIAPSLCIPYHDIQSNDAVLLGTTRRGGHIGWVRIADPTGAPWCDAVVLQFFDALLGDVRRRPAEQEQEETLGPAGEEQRQQGTASAAMS